jgi:hypothetical protein
MLTSVVLALVQGVVGQPATGAAGAAGQGAARVHPLITEVLYAVPKEGDADQDGKRSATGDEFIELVNPGPKPINMKGYTLSNGRSPKQVEKAEKPKADPKDGAGDKAKGSKAADKPKTEGHRPEESRIRFTFPELVLQPGEVVVVFNGFESSTPGPVGDTSAAAGKNEKFGGAYVFSMHCTSQYQALANAGDCVLLMDPDGNAVECVTWGSGEKKPEKEGGKVEKVECGLGSVQRTSLTGGFVRHQDLPAPYGGMAWSPGRFGETK